MWFKNLTEEESAELRKLMQYDKIKSKDLFTWVQRLSEARDATKKVQTAFDRYEEEKEKEINLLQRQKAQAEQIHQNNTLMALQEQFKDEINIVTFQE
jgi:hypothetical protein